jgi:hypothetical protein
MRKFIEHTHHHFEQPVFGDADPNGDLHPAPSRGIQIPGSPS